MPNNFQTREEWLNFVMDQVRPDFKALSAPIPVKVRLSVGFTSAGYRGKRIGECWSPIASADKYAEIFIKPDQDDAVRVAGILVHELVHAAVGHKAGHGAPFRKVAVALGLEGKMTATTEGPKFKAMIAPVLKKAGPLPHKRLNSMRNPTKKQTTRLLKVECTDCSYVVRMSAKAFAMGAPYCGVCMEPMTCEGEG